MRSRNLARGGSAVAALTLCSSLLVLAGNQASAAAGCSVDYQVHQWDTGFTATVAVRNLGDAIPDGWTLEWDFSADQRITNHWSSKITQSGQHITARNPDWATSLATGGSHMLGFQASYSGTNQKPTSVTLNGKRCDGGPVEPTTTTNTTTNTNSSITSTSPTTPLPSTSNTTTTRP